MPPQSLDYSYRELKRLKGNLIISSAYIYRGMDVVYDRGPI